jgi:hypothetical protein
MVHKKIINRKEIEEEIRHLEYESDTAHTFDRPVDERRLDARIKKLKERLR